MGLVFFRRPRVWEAKDFRESCGLPEILVWSTDLVEVGPKLCEADHQADGCDHPLTLEGAQWDGRVFRPQCLGDQQPFNG